MKAREHRDNIVRAILGTNPAMTAIVANPEALDAIANVLAENERAKAILCAKKYGAPNMTIDAMVKLVPETARALFKTIGE
jgi:hypothetical protein